MIINTEVPLRYSDFGVWILSSLSEGASRTLGEAKDIEWGEFFIRSINILSIVAPEGAIASI